MWDLIVSVPDHCLSFYFGMNEDNVKLKNKISIFFSSLTKITKFWNFC